MVKKSHIPAGIYYTIAGAADRLQVTPSRVRQLIRAGQLEHIKISDRNHLIPDAALKLRKKSG